MKRDKILTESIKKFCDDCKYSKYLKCTATDKDVISRCVISQIKEVMDNPEIKETMWVCLPTYSSVVPYSQFVCLKCGFEEIGYAEPFPYCPVCGRKATNGDPIYQEVSDKDK